jgi:hypothetical protein
MPEVWQRDNRHQHAAFTRWRDAPASVHEPAMRLPLFDIGNPIEDFWESDPAKTETHQREGLPTRDGKAAGKTRVNPSSIGNPHAVRLKVMCNNCNHIFEFKHDCCPKCGGGSMASIHTRTSRKNAI